MNYFFDTSALVKIYHDEEGADKVLEIYDSEGQITISDLSKVEFYSTIYRKYRERAIDLETLNLLIEKFDFDVENKYEILFFSTGITEQAQKLLREHGEALGIRSLDSLQLSFFDFYCDKEDTFVCWDNRLTNLAREKNFKTLSKDGSSNSNGIR
ncbi:type II toxin-antitoxin system VapC family toxin [Acidobacteriota bacterium]